MSGAGVEKQIKSKTQSPSEVNGAAVESKTESPSEVNGAVVEKQIQLNTESAVNMQDVVAGTQIEQLVTSIRLEAAEISVSSEEEFNFEKLGLVDPKQKKMRQDGEPCEKFSLMKGAVVEKQIELKTESAVNMQDAGAGNQVDQIEQLVRSIRLEAAEISVSSNEVDPKQKKIGQDGEPCEKLVGVLDKLKQLDSLGSSLNSALLYLELRSNKLLADAVQPMVEAANQFLRSRYNDITKCSDEVLGLPLAGFESVLASDHLLVACEDNVLDLVLKYLQMHYPSIEERENVLMSRLIRLLRFQYLTTWKLMTTTSGLGFNSGAIAKLLIDNLDRKQAPRAYFFVPVEVIQWELSQPRCEVYIRLRRDLCANLFSFGRIISKPFLFNGRDFVLYTDCNMTSKISPCLGLYLWMPEKESETCKIRCRFSVIAKPREEFVETFRASKTLRGGRYIGVPDLLRLPWAQVIADDSKYFVSDFLHLKAELTVIDSPSEMNVGAGVEKQNQLSTELEVNMQDVGAGNQVDQIEQLVRSIHAEISVSSEEVDPKQKKIGQEGEPREKLVGVLDKLKQLDSLGLSLDSALLCLELQSNELLADAVQPMVEPANQFLRSRYNDITKCFEEVLRLPLAGFQSVLASDDLLVPTEDEVLDLVVKYLRKHYPSTEECENVLLTRLIHLLRLQYVTTEKLKTTHNLPGFNSEAIAKALVDNLDRTIRPRAYTVLLIEVRQYDLSRPRCEVYMRLERAQCADLFPSGKVNTKAFLLNGRSFCLRATCNMDEQAASQCLGLYLCMPKRGSEACLIRYKFSVISKPREEYEAIYQATNKFTGGVGNGVLDLLKLPWEQLIATNSKYFVANALYLKADVMFVRNI